MKNSLAAISKDLGVSNTKKTAVSKDTKPIAGAGISVYRPPAKGDSQVSVSKASPGISVYKPPVRSDAPDRIDLKTFLDLESDDARLHMLQEFLKTKDEKKKAYAANSLYFITENFGLLSLFGSSILDYIMNTLNFQDSSILFVENCLNTLKVMINHHKRSLEPFLLVLLPILINKTGDKQATIRDAASDILNLYTEFCSPQSFRLIFPIIFDNISNEDWKIKVTSLNCLKNIAPRMSKQLSPLLPVIIPKVSECVIDSKKQVQQAGIDSLTAACHSITNDDIRPLVPKLVSVIAHPEESEATLNSLLETTFVANVDSAVLALLAPLLVKVLKGRSSALKRKACRVIDIMCRLVQNPSDAAPFIPMLLPALDRAIDELLDQEIISVAKQAREILVKAVGEERISEIMSQKGLSMSSFGIRQNTSQSKLSSTGSLNGSSNNLVGLTSSHSSNVNIAAMATDSSYDVNIVEMSPTNDMIMPVSMPDDSIEFIHQTIYQEIIQTIRSMELSHFNQYHANIICDYISQLLSNLIVYDASTYVAIPEDILTSDRWRYLLAGCLHSDWIDCTSPYISSLILPVIQKPADMISPETSETAEEKVTSMKDLDHVNAVTADQLIHSFRLNLLKGVPDKTDDIDEEGSNLCNFGFSLAYGGKILLQNTFLRLGRGRRYGVMGKNGVGKTTLLTNIGTGNIEGLPSNLRTFYLQHDDASDDFGLSIIDETMNRKDIQDAKITREEAYKALSSIAFTDAMINSPRSALSGGWKMKLLIVRAMLCKADIILMDEPTNHLDSASVQWLIDNIRSLTDTTCMIVSHDTAFLDAVITDVIHYENKKLVYYHGNLSDFVSIHPEAKYYFELSESSMKFKFPVPERLDGVNSTTRAILKLDNVSYTYPGASQPTLRNITVKVCLGSRIAIIGANGAGKSTLVKMLVQETEPDKDDIGEVYKHMNLRVAYVAQHSFHHVEQHLDESPVDYIKWRFSSGVDKEEFAKPIMNTEEDENDGNDKKEPPVKRYGDVDQVVGRRKNGRTMEYECTFIGQTKRDPNKYIPVEQMIEMGLSKLVQQMDARVAAMAAGLDVRPLLTAEIQSHLDDFNLEAEFGTFSTIRRLSGGQKVKLVLAAAMWNRPHVLVLDEPTNYLDREALGALKQAIKEFAGGIVIISHNSEFIDSLCTEKWLIKDGQCYTEGEVLEDGKVRTAKSNKKEKPPAQEIVPSLKEDSVGNLNSTIQSEVILNPKTLEGLSKKETRKLEKLAQAAGVSLKEYVSKINSKSPEWKWL